MQKLLTLTAALVLMAGVVFAQDVSYNFDQQADFSKYKTYKWVQIAGGDPIDQLTAQQIAAAFDRQFVAKGLTRTAMDTADLYVGYQVALKQEKEITTFGSGGYGYGPGWGGRWYGGYYGGGISTTSTSTIHIGSLALDIYDPARKQLVWRGVASKQLDEKASPEKRAKNLDKGAAKLLKNFPPKVKK